MFLCETCDAWKQSRSAILPIERRLTMSNHPPIPKRLAARIRGAQKKVEEKRGDIMVSEYNVRQDKKRVKEFESDPNGFAARHYGQHGVDSYPVQTNIERCRERISYHNRRKNERIGELAELETALMKIEEEILAEVNYMRPTAGRVPWPDPLPTFQKHQKQFADENNRLDEELREERKKDDEEFERLIAEEETRSAEEYRVATENFQQRIASMPPEEYARFRTWADYVTDGLKTGRITISDILAML